MIEITHLHYLPNINMLFLCVFDDPIRIFEVEIIPKIINLRGFYKIKKKCTTTCNSSKGLHLSSHSLEYKIEILKALGKTLYAYIFFLLLVDSSVSGH